MTETRMKICPPCDGRGRAWGFAYADCPLCKGKGSIPIDPRKTLPCAQCNEKGRRYGFDYALCHVCGGYGAVDPNPLSRETISSVWFVKGGKPYTERKRLGEVLDTLTGEARVCDPFFLARAY